MGGPVELPGEHDRAVTVRPGVAVERGGRPRRGRRVVRVVLVVALLEAIGAGAWLYSSGWRVSTVGSPSMSPGIPVGALAVTRPLEGVASLGSVIVFHPPGDAHAYIHRVVARAPGPVYRTKGDNDALRDPWSVPARAVVGRVVAVLPDVGWLVLGAPYLGGAFVAAAIVSLLFPRWRRWAAVDGACAALFVISMRLHPLVRWQIVTITSSAGRFHTWLFNTGILPIKVTARLGTSAAVAPGHSAILSSPLDARVLISGASGLSVVQRAIVAAASALPLVASVLAACFASASEPEHDRSETSGVADPQTPSAAWPPLRTARDPGPSRWVRERCECPPGPCWFDGACRWSNPSARTNTSRDAPVVVLPAAVARIEVSALGSVDNDASGEQSGDLEVLAS